ncbi:MAG: hypothetical protein GXZ03_05085 [Proteiniphilum sp.]|nr:hypothetical protein [Proteiniphilum sp.]
MKFTTKLLLTWILIFLLFYLAVISIVALFWNIKIEFWQLALVFIIAGVLPPAIITTFFYKKLDYMESQSSQPPSFKGGVSNVLSFKSRSKDYYNEVFQRIDRGFIISYSDKESGVVKFRTDSRILSWGVCGYIKLLEENNVLAIVYPMNPNSERETKLVHQSINLLKAVLNR